MSPTLFVRTCQECGHRQVMKDPSTQKGEGWRNAKCRRCKSEALDYGSDGWIRLDGKLVQIPQTEEQE